MVSSAIASTVAAQDIDEESLALYGDKSTVSIATGSRQELRRAPAVATVITAEDIAAMGATTIDEVLEAVPGMHVIHAPSMNATSYIMRGGAMNPLPAQVSVLQNGIPTTLAATGNKGSLWGGLPVENIARIEVIRGPGSALYGADAFTGVVNIVTRTATSAAMPETQFGVRAASFRTRDVWAQHIGKLGPLDVAAFLRVGDTAGYKETVTADAQMARDATALTRASLAPGRLNSGYDAVDASLDLAHRDWRWRSGYKLRDDMGTYAGLGAALDPLGRGRSERVTSDLSWADPLFAEDWGISLMAAFMHYKQTFPVVGQILPPGATLATGVFVDGMRGAPEFAERQARFSATAVYMGFNTHNLRFGAGHDDLNLYRTRELRNFAYRADGTPIPLAGPVFVEPFPYITPHRRTLNYLYFQDEWGFSPYWTLTAGIRRDSYSDAGATTNPRLALVWEATPSMTAKFLYGQAFRAPSLTEEYSDSNPIARGNPNLKPETNRTWEAALAWRANRELQLNLSVFRYAMRDIIRAIANPVAGTGTTYQNTGGQTGRGLEFEAVWDASRTLRVSGHYSQQKSIDEATDTDAGYSPHRHVYARADWRFASGWLLSPQVNWIADRKRAFGDARPDIPDYSIVDLTLRSTGGRRGWSFAASVRNLFDADAREPTLAPGAAIPNDLPMPKRWFFVQATYSL